MKKESKIAVPREQLRFPVSYLLLVKAICQEQGRDFARLLEAEFQLTEQVLDNPHTQLDGHKMMLILNQIKAFIEDNPQAQFQLMEQFPLSIHGYVGLAAMTSSTLRQALEVGVRYFSQVMPAYQVETFESEDVCVLTLQQVSDFDDCNDLFAETVACAIASVVKFTSIDFAKITVEFAHESLVLSELCRIYPELQLKMGCSEHRFLLPTAYLEKPLFTGNETTQKMLAEILEEKQRALEGAESFSIKISKLLEERMERALTTTLEDVCDSLHISKRTLSRRLNEEGTNFKSLHNESRLQQAKKLWMGNPKLSTAAIAETLGFSNEASLSRFIKQQTGLSPSELRKRPR